MSIQRDKNMIEAVLTLIGEMGDMPIPISALWYERIIRAAGRDIEIFDVEDREVDAIALETLCVFALEKMERDPAMEWLGAAIRDANRAFSRLDGK